MNKLLSSNFEHVLCFLILLTRIGDILSTWLISPTLRLEANPVVRKLGWRFAIVSVIACLLPYYNTALGVTAFVSFCLVCASNFTRMWRARAMGEVETEAWMLALAQRSTLSSALIPHLVAQAFLAAVGAILLWLSGGPTQWAYWVALGILLSAFAFAFYGTLFNVRLFRRARQQPTLGASHDANRTELTSKA